MRRRANAAKRTVEGGGWGRGACASTEVGACALSLGGVGSKVGPAVSTDAMGAGVKRGREKGSIADKKRKHSQP